MLPEAQLSECTLICPTIAPTIRNHLSSLSTYTLLVNGNVERVNYNHVHMLQDSLILFGEECLDQLVYLFSTYCSVQEINFGDFMKLHYTFSIKDKC